MNADKSLGKITSFDKDNIDFSMNNCASANTKNKKLELSPLEITNVEENGIFQETRDTTLPQIDNNGLLNKKDQIISITIY